MKIKNEAENMLVDFLIEVSLKQAPEEQKIDMLIFKEIKKITNIKSKHVEALLLTTSPCTEAHYKKKQVFFELLQNICAELNNFDSSVPQENGIVDQECKNNDNANMCDKSNI